MKHIYIDESINDDASLATLVAIEFDSKIIKDITEKFYAVLKLIIDKFPKEKNGSRLIYPTPVLHGQNFLRNSSENKNLDFSSIDDEFKFQIFIEIVGLVNKYKLKIVRVGYSNYEELNSAGFLDDKMYRTNWVALANHFNQFDNEEEYIFVMDGTDAKMITTLSSYISQAKGILYIYEMKDSLIIPNVDRFLNNVFYIPQKFCEPLQIVDIISYLLQKVDYVNITGKSTKFNNRLIEISKTINEELVINSIIKMNFTK